MAMATIDAWRLAVGRFPPSGLEQQRGWKENGAWRREKDAPSSGDEWRLAAWWSSPDGDDAVMMLQARGAWRCVMPAGGLDQCPSSDVGCTLGGFGSVKVREERFLHSFR